MSEQGGAGQGASEGASPSSGEQAVGDIVFALIMIPLTLFVAWEGWNMPRRGDFGFLTSPGLSPLLLATLVLVMTTIVTVSAVRAGAATSISARVRSLAKHDETRRALVLMALVASYALLIGRVPFPIITAVFLAVTFTYVRVGSWLRITIATAIGTALTGWAIPTLFSMPMP